MHVQCTHLDISTLKKGPRCRGQFYVISLDEAGALASEPVKVTAATCSHTAYSIAILRTSRRDRMQAMLTLHLLH